MAGKKETRSSKTDHVLHLLSGIIPEQENASTEQEAAPAASPSPSVSEPSAPAEPAPATPPAAYPPEIPQHRAAPILEVAHTNHDALAESIRQALEENLTEELNAEKSSQPAKAPPEPEPIRSDKPQEAPSEEPAPNPDPTPAVSTQPSKEIAEETPVQTPSQPNIRNLPDNSVWMDVMPILVEEQLDHYLDLFHVCKCNRCRADVQALALNGLPTKYIVIDKEKAVFMLGFYRYRFQSSVAIELSKACETVKKHPRHG